jgi:type I restriction enzyme S subunit
MKRTQRSPVVDSIIEEAVGVIPDHWDVKSVDELITEGVLCKIQDGNHGEIHPVAKDYVSDGVPFLMSGNIREGRVRTDDLKYLTEEHAGALRLPPAQRGDVLLTHKGNQLGRSAVMDNLDVAVLTPQITYYRVKASDRLDSRFLKFVFDSPAFQHQFTRDAQQSTRPFVSITNQRSLYLPFPPLAEQKRIATVLGALDDKIELNRRLNRILEGMARAVFKAWFIDFEPVKAKAVGATSFPGMPQPIFDQLPDCFVDSDLGEIPEGWKVGKLGDVMRHPSRAVQPNEVDDETPYVGLEHIPRKSISLSEWGVAGSVTSNKHRFLEGEFLFGKLRPYFHKVCVAPVDGVCSTDVVVVAPSSANWNGFVLFHISSPAFIAYTTAASTGTKMPRTNWKDMSSYLVCMPDVALAKCVVGLLFKTHLGSARRDPLTRFRYGEHADFDEFIDNDFGPFEVLDVPLVASEALFRTDFNGYRDALVRFRQEQDDEEAEVQDNWEATA